MTFLFGATSRELANDEGIQTGSRTGRKTLDNDVATLLSHGIRQGLRDEILGATYVCNSTRVSRLHILCDMHENVVGGSSR